MKLFYRQFIFKNYHFSAKTGQLALEYSLDNKIFFKEKLIFPKKGIQKDIDQDLLDRALFNVFLITGISYWKTYCPKNIIISVDTRHGVCLLSKAQAKFWNTIYTKGLGEFYYKNKIDFRGLVNFPSSVGTRFIVCPLPEKKYKKNKRKILIPFGGGKDSAVVAELMKNTKDEFGLFTLRDFSVVRAFAKKIGGEHIVVKRILSSELERLQNSPVRPDNCPALQGHIPFTALTSFVSALAAVLYGYDDIVYSSEETASYSNRQYLGMDINHQWSKSFEAEKLIAGYIEKNISPDIRYFSLLRPFSELKIAQLFCQYKKYFSYFASCNSNFLFGKETKKPHWCLKCPKCLFTFILMSAWISKKELLHIFKRNMFDDMNQIPEFRNLLGVGAGKPFECVGTPEEVMAALILVSKKNDFEQCILIQYFKKDIFPKIKDPRALVAQCLEFHKKHRIPKDLLYALSKSRK